MYHWLGHRFDHAIIDVYGLDGFVWMSAGAALVVASVGVAAIGLRRNEEGVT